MSTEVLFTIGVVVFALTVFGVVMAGGLLLTSNTIERDPQVRRRVGDDQADTRFPTDAQF